MKSLKDKRGFSSAFFFALGVFYSAVLSFVGYALAGAGHGTEFFGLLITSPEPFGLAIWPCIGALLPWRKQRFALGVIFIFLFLNYISVLVVFPYDEMNYIQRTLSAAPLAVLFVLVGYLVMQTFVWCLVIQSLAGLRRQKIGIQTDPAN